jgi:hypothetical protein
MMGMKVWLHAFGTIGGTLAMAVGMFVAITDHNYEQGTFLLLLGYLTFNEHRRNKPATPPATKG